jgi:hypothetical protein
MVKITKEIAQKKLGDVAEEKRFWCIDGRYLKNLEELKVALEEMSDETLNHHLSGAKNDFANWVKDVIGDEKLARDLRKSTNRTQAAKAVSQRIAWLKGKMFTTEPA